MDETLKRQIESEVGIAIANQLNPIVEKALSELNRTYLDGAKTSFAEFDKVVEFTSDEKAVIKSLYERGIISKLPKGLSVESLSSENTISDAVKAWLESNEQFQGKPLETNNTTPKLGGGKSSTQTSNMEGKEL